MLNGLFWKWAEIILSFLRLHPSTAFQTLYCIAVKLTALQLVPHQNGAELTEAKDVKKRWQQHTELYKKDFNDPGNHDGVTTHLEPDILECKVKWALGSITMNKVSGGDGILVELLQILKDDAVKVLPSICQQILKTQQWPQDWKRSVFIQIPKKAMPKNAQTTAQLHSSHTLVK